MEEVIVVGGNHHNTLGVVRSLGRSEIRPIVIVQTNLKRSFVLKSRYIKEGRKVACNEDAINLLLNEFADNSLKKVLIACSDEIASLIDINRDKLSQFYFLPGGAAENSITPIMDKKRMGDLAESVGLTIPMTIECTPDSFKGTSWVRFPCIIKPAVSKEGTKDEIKVFANLNQLQEFFENHPNRRFVVQEYIQTRYEFQLIGCSLNGGDTIIIPGVSEIIRPAYGSNTGFLRYVEMNDSYLRTLKLSCDFIRKTGYSGLFSIEFLRDSDDMDYFIEINFRNDGNAIAVTNAGVNLPLIWYLANIGQDYSKAINSIHQEYVMPEFVELLLYRSGELSREEWMNDWKQVTSFMDYAEDDPSPTNGWWNYKKYSIVTLVKSILKR